jgi:transposase InsO family protein
MKGIVGTKTKIGSVLPGAVKISKIYSPSKEAKGRLRWIDYQKKTNNVALICRHFDIQRSLFYKWHNRYQRLGIKGLESQPKKPKRFRQSNIPLEYIDLVRKLRKQYPYFSKYKLAVILKRDFDINLSDSTVGRIIKKHNLFFRSPYRSKKDRMKYNRPRLPKDFKALSPGDLVQADTKHIPFFGPKMYFYVIKDCLTKMVSIKVSYSISSKQSMLAFKEASRHIPYEIKNVNTDNGPENLKYLRQYCGESNINHYYSRPRQPKDNTFVENMIGTIEREFIQQGKLAFDVKEQQRLIDEWLDEYHTFRPHQALGYLTPHEYYERIKNG